MIPYDSQYVNNEPAYVINGLKFICTCDACPEQYDVIYTSQDKNSYIVGYVRLRYGKLTCEFPDVGGKLIYKHDFFDHMGWLGVFPTEQIRLEHLTKITDAIMDILKGVANGS